MQQGWGWVGHITAGRRGGGVPDDPVAVHLSSHCRPYPVRIYTGRGQSRNGRRRRWGCGTEEERVGEGKRDRKEKRREKIEIWTERELYGEGVGEEREQRGGDRRGGEEMRRGHERTGGQCPPPPSGTWRPLVHQSWRHARQTKGQTGRCRKGALIQAVGRCPAPP